MYVNEVKGLLQKMNSSTYGNILDYVYMHRRDGSIGERQFAKFLRDLGVEPIEKIGKIIELEFENPGFRLGTYYPLDTINWRPGDKKKFRVCTTGWRFDGEQILPIEITSV